MHADCHEMFGNLNTFVNIPLDLGKIYFVELNLWVVTELSLSNTAAVHQIISRSCERLLAEAAHASAARSQQGQVSQ